MATTVTVAPLTDRVEETLAALGEAHDRIEELTHGLGGVPAPTLADLGALWRLDNAIRLRTDELEQLRAQLACQMSALDSLRTDAAG